jgi:PadR family transcriptional regulator PadR
MKVTYALVQVAGGLMADPQGRHWGYDLSRRSGVRSGVLYPILHRMLEEGWLSDGWEDGSELNGRRPPRRYYVLTEDGISQLGGILRKAETDSRFSALVERLA